MKKTVSVLLSCCLVLSGCVADLTGCEGDYHFSSHCQEFSEDRMETDTEHRDGYNDFLTPVSDFTTECYCHTEDTAIAGLVGAAYAVLFTGLIAGLVVTDNLYWPPD